jgi:ABC-type branched-subunit amino acid transport system substrate-binding protein
VRLRLAALALLALLAGGCGGKGKGDTGTLLVIVNAPFTKTPYVGTAIERGVTLAVREVNARGGIRLDNRSYLLRMERLDNALSPRRAVENVRKAVDSHAIGIVDEGTGVDADWEIANRAGIPIGIVYQGGGSLVDPEKRPNVFRIAPTDRGIAFRLSEYLVPKKLKIAILSDDSGYGTEGRAALDKAFSYTPGAVVAKDEATAGALDLAPQVARLKRSGATALVVWGLPSTIASAITAARTSGWQVPVFAPPAAADPLVRQLLARHRSWVEGLTFAAGRLTAEVGAAPFESFVARLGAIFEPVDVGVKSSDGPKVIQPPEISMYAYDYVRVLAEAVQYAGSTDPKKVTPALEQVSVEGANGDSRGFNENSHEGVVDDDVYFARFHDMTFEPVKDDALSATLQPIVQTR